MPTRRTWISLLFWVLDRTVTNRYLILSLGSRWVNYHRMFALTVVWEFVDEDVGSRRIGISSKGRNSVIYATSSRATVQAEGYVSESTKNELLVMRGDEQHILERVYGDGRSLCSSCRRLGSDIAQPSDAIVADYVFVSIRSGTAS